MKTLYINQSCNIVVDTENNEVSRLEGQRESISRIYMANEPMHVVFGSGEYSRELDVKKDDLIVVFYDGAFKNRIIAVKSKDWVANLKDYNKREEEAKLEWAKAQAEKDAAPCGDKCVDECTNCAG